jgi:hypothetical protein
MRGCIEFALGLTLSLRVLRLDTNIQLACLVPQSTFDYFRHPPLSGSYFTMTNTDIQTFIAMPTEPWEAAKERFLAEATPIDHAIFSDASLENLFYSSSAAFKKHEAASKTRSAQRKLKPLIDQVEGYAKALDTFAQTSSLVVCPIWGSIRVVLQVAQEYGKYYDKIVEMYARIGDNMPRFRIYEQLFANHERVLAALATAYLDIIKFSTEAMKVFVQARKSTKLAQLAVLRRLWKAFDTRFDSFLTDFRRHQDQVAQVAHLIEAKKARELELANRELQARNAKLDKRRKMLALLSPVDFRAKHEQVRKLRQPGTSSWFIEHDQFRSWLDDPSSGCFCCFGIPGCGKTVLASAVIDSLGPLYADQSSVLCFHYCDYADFSTLDIKYVLGSMLRQLLERIEIPDDVETLLDSHLGSHQSFSIETLSQALLAAASKFAKVLLVLDGIDELPLEGHRTMTRVITTFAKDSARTIKIVVMCRQEDLHVRRTLIGFPSLEISNDDNAHDIRTFVAEAIKARIETGELSLRDGNLEAEIVQALIRGAKQMYELAKPIQAFIPDLLRFLWVRLQVDELCEALNDEAIRKILQDLPKDLEETYERIIRRVATTAGGNEKLTTARKALKWIVCAKRPLTIEELNEAISLKPTDRCLNPNRIPRDESAVLKCCSHLVSFDRHKRTIRLAHYTVQQFLTSRDHRLSVTVSGEKNTPPVSGASLEYSHKAPGFNVDEAQSEIGQLCRAYLRFDELQTQLVPMSRTQLNTGTFQGRTFSRALGISSLTRVALSPFQPQSDQIPSSPLNLQFPSHPRNYTGDLRGKFALLDYVSMFWAWHSGQHPCSGDSVNFRAEVEDLVFHRNLHLEHRPWTRVEFPTQARMERKLFRWALEEDLPVFLDVLRRPLKPEVPDFRESLSSNAFLACYDEEASGEDKTDHPLIRAFRSSSNKCLVWLLKHLNEPGFKTPNAFPAGKAEPSTITIVCECVHLLAMHGQKKSLQQFVRLYSSNLPNEGEIQHSLLELFVELCSAGDTVAVQTMLDLWMGFGFPGMDADNTFCEAITSAITNGQTGIISLFADHEILERAWWAVRSDLLSLVVQKGKTEMVEPIIRRTIRTWNQLIPCLLTAFKLGKNNHARAIMQCVPKSRSEHAFTKQEEEIVEFLTAVLGLDAFKLGPFATLPARNSLFDILFENHSISHATRQEFSRPFLTAPTLTSAIKMPRAKPSSTSRRATAKIPCS